MAWKYSGISSQWDYTRTFSDFKEEFEDTWVFQEIPTKERLAELKKAFKIATDGLKKVDVVIESAE